MVASPLWTDAESDTDTEGEAAQPLRKSIMWGTVGMEGSVLDKCRAIKAAGYDGIEPNSHMNRDEVLSAVEQTGLVVSSVCNSEHWSKPLSHPDAAVRQEGIEAMIVAMEDAKAYLQLTQQEQLICALTGQHSKATILVRIAQVLGHLSYSLGQYKEALTKFAERLNEPGYDRTPDGYAAMFGQFFKGEPTLSLDNPAWMTLTNASVQYVAAIRPGKTEPQLVKRMHYVSFVGMFRSDLFEGLCVGHAPKKCPICGRWFLTIDARHTKYCGGLAPGDQRGRTCRQIGNLRGREQRELADDHPIKAIYTRRMNTILQSTRRGKLDEETAAAMKKLAKDKMLRALSDQRYASTVYEQEMTQDALLKVVQKK